MIPPCLLPPFLFSIISLFLLLLSSRKNTVKLFYTNVHIADNGIVWMYYLQKLPVSSYRNRNSIPKDSLIMLYKTLPETVKNSTTAMALRVFTSENIVKKGQHFQDFEVLNIKGELFRLSALKNKYIYLTFGSLGCGPCRMENKEISKNYDSLAKIVYIVNFSMDVNRVEWEAAAKADGIIWYNVSDMAGMTGKIKTLYDVQAMPTSFLIDKNGIIVEKFNGYSPDNFKLVEQIAAGAANH